MLSIITNNPYRVLGVYSNSPTKDIISNEGKMKAFLKVGRAVSFPVDFSTFLPAIERNEEKVANAKSQIALPNDKVKYAQFWFLKLDNIDDVAFNHLTNGDYHQALIIWGKKDSISSLQNRTVLYLMLNNWTSAISYAEKLYGSYADIFVKEIDQQANTDKNQLINQFIDCLINEKVDLSTVKSSISDPEWITAINIKISKPIIEDLENALQKAKESRGKGSNVRLNAGNKLMAVVKKELPKLKSVLDTFKYQLLADKLANEILQCGIDYFNGTEDEDAPDKAMKLQNYAQSIAVGQMVKDRCQENVKILKEIGPEYKVHKEMERIANRLKRLKSTPSYSGAGVALAGLRSSSLLSDYSIYDVKSLVENSIPDLNSIKQKLGPNNDMYIKISTAVASAAINALVDIINKSQQMAQFMSDKSFLKSDVSTAISLMSKISSLDMTSDCRSYLNGNRSTLNSINSHLNPSSSGGCYIATMAYGSYEHPQVLVLRQFRDNYLNQRRWGKKFIKYYYKHSPIWVEHLKNHKFINKIIRKCLDVFVQALKKQ